MDEMLDFAHELDSTRLYANGSNVFLGEKGYDGKSDFYTSMGYYKERLRGASAGAPHAGETEDKKKGKQQKKYTVSGYINHCYPNAMTNYGEVMEELRKGYQKPVFSFEVGQYEILPDFDEIEGFHGVTRPDNLKYIQKQVKEQGLEKVWKGYVEATGELSKIGYREEIEAVMRTEQLSGISLLGLQDFQGQGTALVGMMNSHLQPKPYPFARPETFQKFFCSQLPLVYLPKYTYENTENLRAEVKIANYGKQVIQGDLEYQLKGKDILLEGKLPKAISCPTGGLTNGGIIEIPFDDVRKASRLDLTVSIGGIANTYPIWVYPPVHPVCPEGVYETTIFDKHARAVLKAGGKVYLSPTSSQEALPQSIQAQFTTDFWSVGTFPMQEGGMGQLIDIEHPIFKKFPTEFHTNWQWWPMATQRAVIIPASVEAIVTEMDSYAYMRHMAQMFECRCGNGRIFFCSMGLQDLQQYPEARALLESIYRYMDSDQFMPQQVCEEVLFERLVSNV